MNHKTTRIVGALIATLTLAGCGASPTHEAAKKPPAQVDAPIHQPTKQECELSAPAIYSFLRTPVTDDIRAGRSGMIPSQEGKTLVTNTDSALYLVSTKDCTLTGLSDAWGVDVRRYMGR